MVVAKRPGREKPAKIEQRKVRGPEWRPQVKQTALLAGPIYTGQAQGERNIWKEGPELSLSLSPTHWGALLFASLDQRALMPWRWIFLLSSKWNRAVTPSCNTDFSKSYNMVRSRPESYNMVCQDPGAVTCRGGFNVRHSKSLLWRDKELRSRHSPDRTTPLPSDPRDWATLYERNHYLMNTLALIFFHPAVETHPS